MNTNESYVRKFERSILCINETVFTCSVYVYIYICALMSLRVSIFDFVRFLLRLKIDIVRTSEQDSSTFENVNKNVVVTAENKLIYYFWKRILN